MKDIQHVTQLEAQLAQSTRRKINKKKIRLFCLSNVKKVILCFGVYQCCMFTVLTYLLTAIGFCHPMAVHIYTQTIHRTQITTEQHKYN